MVARLPSKVTSNGARATWLCICDCGNRAIRYTSVLKRAAGEKVCRGCQKKRQQKIWVTHGQSYSDTQIYRIWSGIRQRCRDTNSTGYRYYGAKGIDRCAEWDDFAVFCRWAYAKGYEPGLTLDRLDPTKGYQPDNCEWVTKGENSRRMNEYHRQRKARLAHG